MRFRGYFLKRRRPYFTGPKSEHVRMLCPAPKNIRYNYYREVVKEWRSQVIFGSAPKIDCLATLSLARILIRRSEEFRAGRRRPVESIGSVSITHYQSMGNAKAITSMEHLAVPGWFRLETREDAEFWDTTLDEHYRAIRRLSDKNSDEIGMVLEYHCRFLNIMERSALRHLLAFLEMYGIFVLRKRAQHQWIHRQFTVKPLEEILE